MDKERLKRVQKQLKQIAKKEIVGLDVAKMIENVGETLTQFRGEVAELQQLALTREEQNILEQQVRASVSSKVDHREEIS